MHILSGSEKEVYLRCDAAAPVSRLRAELQYRDEKKLMDILQTLCNEQIMYSDGNQYLALSVPASL
jgi:hypothetical protein